VGVARLLGRLAAVPQADLFFDVVAVISCRSCGESQLSVVPCPVVGRRPYILNAARWREDFVALRRSTGSRFACAGAANLVFPHTVRVVVFQRVRVTRGRLEVVLAGLAPLRSFKNPKVSSKHVA